MQSKVFQKIAHPWLLGVSLLMVGIFAGAGIQMMRAQNTPFTEPTCDPGEPCNPDVSTFLTTSTTPQTIASDILLNGNLTLQTGKSLLTATPYSGIPINVATTNNFAIVANTSSANQYAIQAVGDLNGGLYAKTLSGRAILGEVGAGGTGFAGKFNGKTEFLGNIELGNEATQSHLTLINGSISAVGAAAGAGKITARDIVASKSLAVSGNLVVNGTPVVSGDMRQTVITANVAGSTVKSIFASDFFGASNNYKMINLQISRANLGGTGSQYPRTWAPVTNGYTYEECLNSSTYSGRLTINSFATAAAYRIIATYRAETVNCNTTDYENPVVSITTPSAGGSVSGNFTVISSPSDNIGVTKVELYVNGTMVLAIPGTPPTGLIQYDFAPYVTSPATQVTLMVKAYDAAGNVGSSFPVNAYVQSALCSVCGGGTLCTNCRCNGVDNWQCVVPGTCADCTQTPGS